MIRPLNPRQRQITRLILAGLSNSEIAVTLGITEGYVKNSLNTIFNALEVTSRIELIAALLLPLNSPLLNRQQGASSCPTPQPSPKS